MSRGGFKAETEIEPRRGALPVDGGLRVLVEAYRERRVFGRDELWVVPVAGSGGTWIATRRIDWVDPNEEATDE